METFFYFYTLLLLQLTELEDFKVRRNDMFKKTLTEFAELQAKHANVRILQPLSTNLDKILRL